MAPLENHFQDKLNKLSAQNRRRTLIRSAGLDFSSNDYLGLASHVGIRKTLMEALEGGMALGSGGSRLLRGNHEAHEELEAFAADFFRADAALFMSTGYLANLAVFTTLPERGDVIVYDALLHASSKEGIHASKAKTIKFAHNDAEDCKSAIKRARDRGAKKVWIAIESLYSMDGDMAPLAELKYLADHYGAYLIVDEAHATGVYGPEGRGLSAVFEGQDNLIAVHTCGKALGQAGALVTLPQVLKDYLINCARSFIYTTAPSPLAAVAVKAALHVLGQEPQRREDLLSLIKYAHLVFDKVPGHSQIMPLIIGEDGAAEDMAKNLQDLGFDIRAIRTPTVPKNTARLRLNITLNVAREDIMRLAQALPKVAAR